MDFTEGLRREFHPISDCIGIDIFMSVQHGPFVGVDADGGEGAEFYGGDGENAGPRAHIKHARAPLEMSLKKAEDEPCRLMVTGPEGHLRVYPYENAVPEVLTRRPGGGDDEPLTDLYRLNALLPLLIPVFFVDVPKLNRSVRRDRPQKVVEV